MKKKVMTMVLAASMLLGMAGCGSSSANDSAAANGNTAGGDQAVAGTEKNDASGNAEGGSQEGTLTVWCWDSFNVDAMKEAGKLYQKDHPCNACCGRSLLLLFLLRLQSDRRFGICRILPVK